MPSLTLQAQAFVDRFQHCGTSDSVPRWFRLDEKPDGTIDVIGRNSFIGGNRSRGRKRLILRSWYLSAEVMDAAARSISALALMSACTIEVGGERCRVIGHTVDKSFVLFELAVAVDDHHDTLLN